MTRCLLSILTIQICLASMLIAGDKSSISFGGEIGGGLSFNNAQFSQLPGIPNCCVEFSPAIGMALGLGAGFEYQTKATLFNSNIRAGVLAMYHFSNTVLRETEQVGNIIDGESVTDGTVEHTIDFTYSMFGIQPYINLPLPVNGLSVDGGFLFGTSLTATVDQKQTLVEPQDPKYTFENGLRTRNEFSGDLPDKSALQAALIFKARYDLPVTEGFSIVPFLRYQLGLTSVMSSAQMSISSFQGGVMFMYTPTVQPEPPAPEPRKEEPKIVEQKVVVPKKLSSTVIVSIDDPNAISRSDTIQSALLNVEKIDTVYDAIPTIFFEANSNVIKPTDIPLNVLLDNVRQTLESNPNARVMIVGRTAYDEDPIFARQRASFIVNKLHANTNQVGVRTESKLRENHIELDEENRSVSIELQGAYLPLALSTHSENVTSKPFDVVVNNVLTCEAGPCATTTTMHIDGSGSEFKNTTTQQTTHFTVPANSIKNNTVKSIRVNSVTTDSLHQSVHSQSVVYLIPAVSHESSRTVHVSERRGNDSTILIGLFEFDAVAFSYVDSSAIKLVRRHLANGGKIVILPGTDNLGTDEYNKALQQLRAQAAVKLLGIDASVYSISYLSSSDASNTTPGGRVMNRSVKVLLTN